MLVFGIIVARKRNDYILFYLYNFKTYTMGRLFFYLVFFISAFSGFAQRTVSVKILQTSDVHGAIFPFDYINNRPMESSLAQVYTYVKSEKANSNQKVVLLDNGDIIQGQPVVYYSNFIDTLNKNIVPEVFNFMGYDAATIGNHDIETGPKVYNKVKKEFEFPWLGANIIDDKNNEPAFRPYTIINKEGIRIAVLGLITPGVPNWLPKNLWPGMHFDDMIETAKHWVKIIQVEEKPDLIIGLFHSGHNAEYGSKDPDERMNENASLLIAQQVQGFDVIFIGHDHDRVCQKVVNFAGDSVLFLDPGSSARYISEATFTFTLDENGKILSKTAKGDLIETKLYPPDSLFLNKFGYYSKLVESFVNRKIGEFTQPTSTSDCYFGPSSFMDFIHTAQLKISKADISFAAPLTFYTTIDKGPVYVRDMFKLYKFENFLLTMQLSGYEIDKYLEYSYGLWFNTMKSENDHLIRFRVKDDGTLDLRKDGKAQLASNYYNFDSALGIIYTVDVLRPVGDRVTISSMGDGSPFIPDHLYKVAINSYRGNGGGGHLTEGCGIEHSRIYERILSSTDKDLRFFIMNLIEEEEQVTPKSFDSWKIIPENWIEDAVKRDKDLLFRQTENE